MLYMGIACIWVCACVNVNVQETKVKNLGSWSSLANMSSTQSPAGGLPRVSTQESFELFKKQKTEREERVSVPTVPSYATMEYRFAVLVIKFAECSRILTKITQSHNEPLPVCTSRFELENKHAVDN